MLQTNKNNVGACDFTADQLNEQFQEAHELKDSVPIPTYFHERCMMEIPEVGEACELPDLRLHLSDPVEPAADNS